MYYVIGASVSSLHRESTDSDIFNGLVPRLSPRARRVLVDLCTRLKFRRVQRSRNRCKGHEIITCAREGEPGDDFPDVNDINLPPHWNIEASLYKNCPTILIGEGKGAILKPLHPHYMH